MTSEAIRGAHETKPFVPFVIRLADGNAVAVPHPEFLYFHPTEARTLVIADARGGVRVLDTLLVVEIDIPSGRGHRRRAS